MGQLCPIHREPIFFPSLVKGQATGLRLEGLKPFFGTDVDRRSQWLVQRDILTYCLRLSVSSFPTPALWTCIVLSGGVSYQSLVIHSGSGHLAPSLRFPFNTLAGVLRLPLASGLLTITDPFFFFGAPFTFFFCFCTDMTVACLLSVWPAPLSQLHPPPPPHHTSPPIPPTPPTIPNLPPLPSCSAPTLCTDCGHWGGTVDSYRL